MKNPKKSRHSERDLAGAPASLCWLTSEAGRNYLTGRRPPSRLSSNPCIRPARRFLANLRRPLRWGLLHVADLQSGRRRYAQHYVKSAGCTNYQSPSARNGASPVKRNCRNCFATQPQIALRYSSYQRAGLGFLPGKRVNQGGRFGQHFKLRYRFR
jgi:hypothetical protein